MRIIDAFWLGNVGFVKVNNGFETKVYTDIAQGVNETYDTEFIAKNGREVPSNALVRFLENDTYNSEYVQE